MMPLALGRLRRSTPLCELGVKLPTCDPVAKFLAVAKPAAAKPAVAKPVK
jgi:hypothetical protein